MLIPSLLIVSDRGGLRAYKVEPNPNRVPGLHLIDSFEAQETHGRYQDKLTDQLGRNKGSGAGAHTVGGADERLTIDAENERRACKHIAERINELVKREKPEGWLLALPAQIERAVMDHVDDEACKRLVGTSHANLLKVEPAKLINHFTELQPA